MISTPVKEAVCTLQKRALACHDNYELDRIERALDELLRNPGGESTPAKYRMRSAMGHAYEALERRKAILPSTSLSNEGTQPGTPDRGYPVVEILEWLRTEERLVPQERAMLQSLAHGEDAESLARRHGLPVRRMRERVSRARRTARQLWPADGLSG
ncbi:hypothetical protein RB628_29805 [Streptomyces sp. ADMS]|uniref:hypothetical protein n=1 Tax=Streptomyces sp. ADMS TaxID=3071415 RepID=UPI00296E4C6C|nr:hypothetical protein [Streptomyces sp. ADMS]MDW4909424.1 hypothetical protein [Streptomyces sp. ADMS]